MTKDELSNLIRDCVAAALQQLKNELCFNDDEIMNSDQLCEYLNISPSYLPKLRNRKKNPIPFYPISNRVFRYSKREIKKFLKGFQQ